MTAAIAILAFAVALAVLVAAAAWLDRHGTPGPACCLTLPARLVMPHTGHHRDKYATEAPAPERQPVQEPRPGDPRSGVRAVPAGATPLTLGLDLILAGPVPATPAPGGDPGQAPYPGGAPVPPGAAPEPHAPARAAAPQPPSGVPPVAADPPGLGRPFAPELVPYPDGNYAIRGADGEWHIRPLAWDGRNPRETGGQAVLVRPAARRHFDHVDRWWTP